MRHVDCQGVVAAGERKSTTGLSAAAAAAAAAGPYRLSSAMKPTGW
jgi:hypothetical protein